MAKISLAKALKEKNRLAGQVKELQGLIKAHNSYKDGSNRPFDVEVLMNTMEGKVRSLISLKAAIQKGNAGIQESLTELAEYKSFIQFLRDMPTTEGEQNVNRYGDTDKTEKYIAVFGAAILRETILEKEEEIVRLQDSIDEYNATEQINYQEATY